MASDEDLEARPGEPEAPGPGPEAREAAPAEPGAGDGPEDGAGDVGQLRDVLEALIFVHRGILPPKTVHEVLGEDFTVEQIAAGFEALREEYERRGGAVVLLEVAGGYQLGTRQDLAPWIQKLDFYEHHRHLSRPTLETLAIIAYRQPATRAEIEAIRGVNVERIVRSLIERKLVRVLGHKDVPGKPMVLGTTKEFLELFGLNSLGDLPPLKDFVEPPSAEGIDEEPAFAVPACEAEAAAGDRGEEGAVPTDEMEAEHGQEREAGSGDPFAPDQEDDIDPGADRDD